MSRHWYIVKQLPYIADTRCVNENIEAFNDTGFFGSYNYAEKLKVNEIC